MKRIVQYVLYWREIYVFIPLAVASLWWHQWIYASLMGGRSSVDPPTDLINISRSLYFIFLMGAIVGLFQKHLFGYRSKGGAPRLRDDIYDTCVTIFLFVFVLVCFRSL
ncbi:MAG TPA: hypothetical protein VNQ90_15675 [Chthoniobacteraceae bacterium]|nr:hypothetical protein [Chthoniobacteraceae bacterium]